MKKFIHYALAVFLGFACVVETQHFRKYQKARNYERMLFTAAAASASAYMASEALEGNWPTWD